MNEDDGLIWAYRVDATGQGEQIGWDELDEADGAFLWMHLDFREANAERWIRERSGLGEIEIEALLADETRPRSTRMEHGDMIVLRGVNLNPGADPEDMVSVRFWVEPNRVITVRRRRLLALQDVREELVRGRGPKSVGEFVADAASRLVERMGGVLTDLDENLDAVEESGEGSTTHKRRQLLDLRREAIALRRYLAPQRDALARLATDRIEWLGDRERLQLREVLDRTTRFVEDLEEARERAAVTQEELAGRLAEQLNQRMYALSIVAGVFLPLSFATGLLGINVAGIPGAEISWAFGAVCGGLVLLGVGEIALFRKLGWL